MELFEAQNFPENSFPTATFTPPDADILLYENFIPAKESQGLFFKIKNETNWQQDEIKIYGKSYSVPRLTAWYGDSDKPYTYSGIQMLPQKWTPTLLTIKERIEQVAETTFTSVLLNYYRNGKDSMGWHRDNEKELGINPVIASISFGETRPFHLRHKYRKDIQKLIIPLNNGSLLLMKGATQHYWEHQVAKSSRPMNERINLTFRKILMAR